MSNNMQRLTGVVLAVALVSLCAGCALFGGGKDDGPVFVPSIEKLTAADAYTRVTEEQRIMKAGAVAIAPLKKIALSGKPEERKAAVTALGTMATVNQSAAPKAVDALVDIYMKRDAVTSPQAAVALKSQGKLAMPLLAELVQKLPPGSLDGNPEWLHPISLMVLIDKPLAIEELVKRLKDEGLVDEKGVPLPNRNLTLTRALRSVTQQFFGYDPTDKRQEKQASVERWRRWWENNKGTSNI